MNTMVPTPSFQVRLDLRVETLMGALALAVPRLPGAGLINHPIRCRARRRWKRLRDHDAPVLIRYLLNNKFWVDDLCRLTAALVDVKHKYLVLRHAPSGLNGSGALYGCDRFAAALVDFCERADVERVLVEGADIPSKVLEAVGSVEVMTDWVGRARQLLGVGPENFRIFPSPLCGAHLAFGPTVISEGASESWVVFGPVWTPRGWPWYPCGFGSEKLGALIRHEIGHAHLNHHTEAAAEVVSRFEHLFAPVEAAMRPQGYGRWDVCLNELILRAAEIRFAAEQQGPAAAKRRLEREERKGFEIIRSAVRAMEEISGVPVSEALYDYLRSLEGHLRRCSG